VLGTMVQKTMKPYTMTDYFNRMVIYLGMKKRVTTALNDYMTGKISPKKFISRSGANLFGKEQMNEALKFINGKKLTVDRIDGFVDRLSRLASDRSQFLYEGFNQGTMFRSTAGRFIGQYTSWPINFLNLTLDRLTNDASTIPQKIGYFARLGAITGGIAYGLYSVGLNPRQWAPWNMMVFQGGPYYQMVDDFMGFLNGKEDRLKSLSRSLASLVPFALEGEGIMRAVQAIEDGNWWEAFMHVMSAPIRQDLYPRRRTPADWVEGKINAAGQTYLKTMGYKK